MTIAGPHQPVHRPARAALASGRPDPSVPRDHAGGARTVDRRHRRGVRGLQRGQHRPRGAERGARRLRRPATRAAGRRGPDRRQPAVFAVAQSVAAFVAFVALLAAGRSLISGSLEAWYVDSLRVLDPAAPLSHGLSCGAAAEGVAMAVGSRDRGRLVTPRDRRTATRGRSPATGSPRSRARSPRSATSWPSQRSWTSATGVRARAAAPNRCAPSWRRSSPPLGPS